VQAGTTAQPTNIEIAPESTPTKPVTAPIQVKAGTTRPKTQTQAEDATPVPSPLGVASGAGADLSGLISSSPSSVPNLTAAPTRVSQGVVQGLLIKRVQPKYPAAALAAHIHGQVQIEATITKEGKVVNPKVLKGDRTLAAAAVDAVRQWRYKPYYLDGVPIEIQTDITINFASN
jgi:protein TonB